MTSFQWGWVTFTFESIAEVGNASLKAKTRHFRDVTCLAKIELTSSLELFLLFSCSDDLPSPPSPLIHVQVNKSYSTKKYLPKIADDV